MEQRRALDERHGEELQRPGRPGRVDRHNVRLVQRGEHLLFAHKARPQLRREPVPADHLDGDAPAQRLLHSLVNLAHSAHAQPPHDAKVPELSGTGRARRRELIQRAHEVGLLAEPLRQRRMAGAIVGQHLGRVGRRLQVGHERGEDGFLRTGGIARLVHGDPPLRSRC